MLKKFLILGVVIMAFVGLYAMVGFYLVPKLATDKLPKLLTEMTGQAVQLQSAHFDPFEMQGGLQGFGLATAANKPLLNLGELVFDVDVTESIRQRRLIFANLIMRKPIGQIERGEDGRFNFSDLIDKVFASAAEAQEPAETSTPPIVIRQITLEDGQIDWLDKSEGQPKQETLQLVNVSIAEMSTRPNAKPAFVLNLKLASGGGLDLQGHFDLARFGSQGTIKLDGIALSHVWQLFFQDSIPLDITDGRLWLQSDFAVSHQDQSGLQLLINKADVEVKRLLLTDPVQVEDLISLPSLAVSGIKLDWQKHRLNVASISSKDAKIKAWLQADGQINYQALFAEQMMIDESQAADVESVKPWQIELGELALSNYQIEFTDHSQAKPVDMVLSELNCTLHDYTNVDTTRLPLEFSARFNQSGSLKLAGNLGLSPFLADWAIDIQAIDLKNFQPYIDPFLKLDFVDGDFNTQGNLQLSMADALQLNYQGEANIDSLITRDKTKNQDFVKWHKLEVKQMVIDLAKQDFKFGKVVFDQPYMRFMIKNDGTNNVSDIFVAQTSTKIASNEKQTSESKAKTVEPVVSIGKIELKQGQSNFADYSLILPFIVKMNDLSGDVDGFVSDTDSAVKLKLQGTVHDLATVNIQGNYQLQSGDSDIALSFNHLPLPLVTPYMAEFAGYSIKKGQMALDLKYTIKNGQLTAQNKVFIDQLVLGEKIKNPRARSLPLELGVALLRDADGKINLDFPITGSLKDPEFSVGSMMADIIVNLITKTVTSPFKAIASLFDSDDDLSTVNFAAGSSDLSPAEIEKLDVIAKALAAKPELVLEIKGEAYEVQDWPVMRFAALMDVLKKMKSGELRDKGERIRSEYIELSDDEYKRLLAKFYAEVFPQKIEYSLFGKPRIQNHLDADFYSQARNELEAIMQPEPQRLNNLAVERANRIFKYLTMQAGVDRGRIYILATELSGEDGETDIVAHLYLNVAS